MYILMATAGTRGDVQPMLALALQMRQEGHRVQLCGPPEHRQWVESYDLSYAPVGRDIQKMLTEQKVDPRRGLKSLRVVRDLVREELPHQFERLLPLAEKADLILGASAQLAAPSVAEYYQIPYRFVAFCPQVFGSRYHPPPIVPRADLPSWLNRLLWWVFGKIWKSSFQGGIQDSRDRLGLPPISDLYRHTMSDNPILAADAELGALPPDLEDSVEVIGACRLPQTSSLSAELLAWLDAGPAPIYVGFGSVTDDDPQATAQLLAEAAQHTGRRILFQQGWSTIDRSMLPDTVHLIDVAPHSLLFPRMALVVHHGGAGTTHAAARAGVPQWIIPHAMDQPWWGHRVYQMELGPRPLHRNKLTSQKLVQAWHVVQNNQKMSRCCQALAQRMAQREATQAHAICKGILNAVPDSSSPEQQPPTPEALPS